MERILAIGDIHGCSAALRSLLHQIQPTIDDTVVILGDVIDRGPNSRDVIDQLLVLQQRTNLICILGNHEEMLLDSLDLELARESWLNVGGLETLNSYGGDLTQIPNEHVRFLQSFIDYWESETEIFVHANLEPDVAFEEQTFPWLRWSRLTGNEKLHPSGKRVICGHTALPTGVPALLDGLVCIDTWPNGGKWLTCLDTTSNLIFQASESGEIGGPTPLSEIAIDFTSTQ